MVPLTLVLRHTKATHELKKGSKKINHLLFMDDLEPFLKNEDQIDNLVKTVTFYSGDIKMEFWLPKRGVLTMKRGKIVKNKEISMLDGKMMKNIEEGGYKYLGILEADGVKHEEMKDQIKKEYIRRVRIILKSKLNGGNMILAINLRAFLVVRCGAGIIS